jgi:hypothetical protein
MTGPGADPVAMLDDLLGCSLAEQVLRVRAAADPEVFLLQLSDTADRIAADDVGRGLAVREALVALADEAGGPEARCEVRRRLGMSLAYAGQLPEAIRVTETASAIAVAASLTVAGARTKLTLLQILTSQGRFDDALAAGFAARAVFADEQQWEVVARAHNNLGLVVEQRGNLV